MRKSDRSRGVIKKDLGMCGFDNGGSRFVIIRESRCDNEGSARVITGYS